MEWEVDLQKMEMFIDRVDEADLPSQEVDGTDAAVSESPSAPGDLVVNVRGRVHRPFHPVEVVLIEPLVDTALAGVELGAYGRVHSKSSWVWGRRERVPSLKPRKTQEDFEFLEKTPRTVPAGSLS
jgi:hypothetical protein